ncbi:MAG: hypothetical protein ACM30I_17640 [Gemmatimonas sp.]
MGRHLAVVVIVAVSAAGCHRVQPVYNVQNRPVPAVGQQSLSLDKVRDAILSAAVVQRWQVVPVRPGMIRATLRWQTHTADADILYSEQSYSIVLAGSSNLKQQDGDIHRNYNRAVQRLEDEINRQLLRAAY